MASNEDLHADLIAVCRLMDQAGQNTERVRQEIVWTNVLLMILAATQGLLAAGTIIGAIFRALF